MITFTDVRLKDGVEYPSSRLEKPGSAFNILMSCELAFGGKVVECTPTKVVTSTTCLGCVDTSTFEGSVEDMRYLYECAKNVDDMRRLNRIGERPVDDGSKEDIHRLHRALREGGGAIRGAMLHVLGNDNAAFVAAVVCNSMKDIVAAIGMVADGDITMAEAHQLLS